MTTIGNINPAALAAIALSAAALTGIAVTAALGNAFGVRRRRAVRPRRKADLGGLVAFVNGLAPAAPDAEAETALSLRNSGVKMDPAALWAARVLFLVLGAAAAAACAGALRTGPAAALAIIAAGGILGYAGPRLWLLRRRAAWRDEIERQLPDALDLLDVCLGAGTSLDAGIRIVSERTPGALGEALSEVVTVSQWSSTLAGLRQLADAADVKALSTFTASLELASRAGLPMSNIVKTQAEAVRVKRAQRVEEEIDKLPTKMILPNYLLIVALVAAIIIPAMSSALGALG